MPSGRWNRLTAALIAGALFVAGLAVAAPVARAGAPIPYSGTWTANGPGDVQVPSNGAFQHPEMRYSLDGAGIGTDRTWTFSAVATADAVIEVPYTYLGLHAWFAVTVHLEAFVNGSYVSLVSAGPTNCCNAPSNGFFFSGTWSFSVQDGDVFGFRVGGSNGDYNNFLRGTLSLDYPPYPKTAVTYTGDTTAPSGSSVSLEATVTAGCRGPLDFTLDRDPLTGFAEPTSVGSGGSTSTAGWQGGVYTVTATFPGTNACATASDSATLTVTGGGGGQPDPNTAVTYTGDTSVTSGNVLTLSATVDPYTCPAETLTYTLDTDPLTGAPGPYPLGPGTQVFTQGWLGGQYLLTAAYPGNQACVAAQTTTLLTVTGNAPYTDPGAVAENTSWVNARLLTTAGLDDLLLEEGEARWFYFPILPDSEVQVDLSNLDQNFDLALYRDIGEAFRTLTTKQDLYNLSAQFAADAYSPSIYSPSIYSPSIYSPSIYSPSIYSPSIYSPSIYSPSIYSPSIYSPSIYSPSIYSPSIYSPSIYSPSIYSPSEEFVEAFASAQTRSLIAVSAREGAAAESIRSATWGNTGNFYVRVQGRNGAYSPTPFHLDLTVDNGQCTGTSLLPKTEFPTISGVSASATTVIVTDLVRMGLTGQAALDFAAALDRLAAATGGVVVDVSASARVNALNAQADEAVACPYAKNLVAEEIRRIVNSYRDDQDTLQYVVIAGGDSVIPFFRYPDNAGLGPESDYVPPVLGTSASEASLRRNTVLGQDAYGSELDLPVKAGVLPVPDLGVGRLVEYADEIMGMIDAYLGLDGGVLPEPTSSLVTGYDFLTSAADTVQAEFAAGMAPGADLDTLITDQGVPTTVRTVGGVPSRDTSWTADDLSTALFGERHDLIFLAGHFSANSTLAADYDTSIVTTDLDAVPGLLENALVFSAGCHSGYNLLDADGIPGLTLGLDWAQAMARQRAVFIGGTGYQYADTDFLAYSARLYAQFAAALRTGRPGDPVAVGTALVDAKHAYLAEKSSLTGIDLKSLIQSALFGLPMTGLDLPGRVPNPPTPVGTPTNPVLAGPGSVLGLETADLGVSPETTPDSKPVLDLDGQATGREFRWLVGADGVQTGPGLPALPQQFVDVTSENGDVLRGVGLRSATYADLNGVIPLTGAPTTEQNGIHTSFDSPVFWPQKIYSVSYFDALTSGEDGRTRLVLTPAQYRAEAGTDPLTNTERRYSAIGLELFYSSNIETYGDNTPALAAPPSITGVSGEVNSSGEAVDVSAHVTGDPSAGIQQVWVTFTGEDGPLHGSWQSVDLVQDEADSTLWSGSFDLPAGQDPADVRFVIQAVNGVGLVSLDNNLGYGYTPGVAVGLLVPDPDAVATTLVLDPGTGTAPQGSVVTVGATLTGAPGGATVEFAIGSASTSTTTDAAGHATATLALQDAVGPYTLTASFVGSAAFGPSSASAPFSITKVPTTLALSGGPASGPPTSLTTGISATLTRSTTGAPIPQRTVYFVLTPSAGDPVVVTRVTDPSGRAALGTLSLPASGYAVTATFLGTVPLPTGDETFTDPTFLASTGGPVPLSVDPLPTSIEYTGGLWVRAGSSLALSSLLTAPPACPAGGVTYHADRDPTTGAPGDYPLGSGPSVSTAGWASGTYAVTVRYAGSLDCAPSWDAAGVTVLPDGGVIGTGKYRVSGATVEFSIRAGTMGLPIPGLPVVTVEQAKKWRFRAYSSAFTRVGPVAGSVRGTGVLEWWNPALKRGKGDWEVVATGVAFTADFTGRSRSVSPTFGISISYTPGLGEPALPNSLPQSLRTGTVVFL